MTTPEEREAKRRRARKLLDLTMTDGQTPQHVYELLMILFELESENADPQEVPTRKTFSSGSLPAVTAGLKKQNDELEKKDR